MEHTKTDTDTMNPAEVELIAALLQKNVFPSVDGRIEPGDFRDVRNRTIFEAIAAIENSGRLSDIVLVNKWLQNRFLTEKAGGRAYILQVAKTRRRMSAEDAVNALIAAGRRIS